MTTYARAIRAPYARVIQVMMSTGHSDGVVAHLGCHMLQLRDERLIDLGVDSSAQQQSCDGESFWRKHRARRALRCRCSDPRLQLLEDVDIQTTPAPRRLLYISISSIYLGPTTKNTPWPSSPSASRVAAGPLMDHNSLHTAKTVVQSSV